MQLCLFLEMAYGQWGNLAGYIYGTAVFYSSNPVHPIVPIQVQSTEDDDESEEEEKAAMEEKNDTEEKHTEEDHDQEAEGSI